jgi:hypothetical protein
MVELPVVLAANQEKAEENGFRREGQGQLCETRATLPGDFIPGVKLQE